MTESSSLSVTDGTLIITNSMQSAEARAILQLFRQTRNRGRIYWIQWLLSIERVRAFTILDN